MNQEKMAALTAGLKTKADKMRVLERAGVTRGDIARFLGVRYQQVRNTLEGDKRTGYAPPLAPSGGGDDGAGVAGAPSALPFRSISIGADGTALLPADLVARAASGERELFAVNAPDGIFVGSIKGMEARVQSSFR